VNQSFSYDGDGNLTNDGQFAYTWDAENRLKSVGPVS
jgi:YD repeat-containing protein